MLSYTTGQLRAAEHAAIAALGEAVLMRRAARAVADAVLGRLPFPRPGRRAVLLVGPGNNGGDALHAGHHLRRRGVAVTAVLTHPDRTHAEGLEAVKRAGGRVMAADSSQLDRVLAAADVLIDGMVGIGATPPLRGPIADLVTASSQSDALRVAIDIPSGIHPDTGAADGPVFRADLTVTIGAMKTGLLLTDAAGQVQIADIGMSPRQWAPEAGHDTETIEGGFELVPAPGPADNKFTTGVVGIVAGSARYPGAAVLSTGGAVRLRPGLVRYLGPQAPAVITRWPEVVATDDVSDTVRAWVVGPGLGLDGAAAERLGRILAADVPVLIDADGLTLAAADPLLLDARRGRVTVLTPHAGEFSRLFPDLDPADRLASTRAAATRSGAIVLLKGYRTVIAHPDGRAWITMTGSPQLATAGSGDVLAGMAGSLLATGLEPARAVAIAAHLHGILGTRAAEREMAGAGALIDLLGSGRGAPDGLHVIPSRGE